MMRPTRLFLAAALVLSLSSCATLAGTNYYSVDQEWALGLQIEAQLAQQIPILDDPALSRYVEDLGQRMVRQTSLGQKRWKFYVVRDPAINAFNVPGGLVYINTGLIAQSGSAAELAGAVAHEIGHGVARHGTQRLSKANELNAVAGVVLGQDPNVAASIAAQIAAQGAFASFSRADEREADRLGVRLMAAAGYNPEGLARLLERLAQQERGGGVALFRSHPLSADRVTSVRQDARSINTAGLRFDDAGFAAAQRRAAGYR